MKTELVFLVYVCILTGLMWVPYILDRVMKWGLMDAVGYPANPRAVSPWASRLKAAHANAVENLAVFAPLVLVANAMGISNSATVMAATVYFWARLTHAIAYTLATPWMRTIAFTVGVICQMTFALKILGLA